MAQRWFFCRSCYCDRIFEWIDKSHGLFGSGHVEWRCTVCGDCDLAPARSH